MSTVKISQLPFTSTVCDTALVPIVQNGTTCSAYACNIGSTSFVPGSGTFSVQRNGNSNNASGDCSAVLHGIANIAGNCFTTSSGTNNIVCTSNSHILGGQFNVIACDAKPNFSVADQRLGCTFNSGSGGYYNGFVAGQTTLAGCFGDLTSYYTPGSTLSSLCTYEDPQPQYINLVVCGSSYNAGTCETTICVNPTINTGSGYIIKTSTFSTYSAYHPNTIAGGSFNTINEYTSAGTISGGYNNTVSGGYGTIGGGRYNQTCDTSGIFSGRGNATTGSFEGFIGGGAFSYISNSPQAVLVGGRCNNVTSSLYGVIGGGRCNIINNSFAASITSGTSNCITTNSDNSAILSGAENRITTGSTYSAILGGTMNIISSRCSSFIVGACITADRSCTTFVNNLSIKNIPTSAAGLPSGSVWSNAGVLTIVP